MGEVIAVIAIMLGVGIWAQINPELLAIARYLGVAYLLWLAARMWNDRTQVASADLGKAGGLAAGGAGVALCLGNPATLLMQMLLLPPVAPTGVASLDHMALVVLVTFAAFGIVFFGTIPLARQFQRIIASPRSSSMLNRAAACVIAATSARERSPDFGTPADRLRSP